MKMRTYVLLSLLVCLFSATTFAQELKEKKHPIDKAFDACMDNEKNQTTAGMVECADRAYKAWDKELNIAYNKLMSKLNPPGKQSLKAAQLEWIKYRDSQSKLFNAMYDQLQGTMYIPIFAYRGALIVKARTLELQDLSELVEPQDK